MCSEQFENRGEVNIMNDEICEDILNTIIETDVTDNMNKYYIHKISSKYNIEKNNVIKIVFNYIIKNKQNKITPELLNYMENIIHSLSILNDNIMLNNILFELRPYLI